MSGLVNFANAIGSIFAVMLPLFCYLGALALMIGGAWGLWRQAQPDNPFRGKPWIPALSILMSGMLASFDQVLTMANRTGGSSVTVSVASIASYVPPSSTPSLGATPTATVVNIVTMFAPFFQSFGALACLFAVLAWRATVVGRSNRPQGASLVQFVFGVLLINCVTVSGWIAAFFA